MTVELAQDQLLTVEEYLAMEELAEVRHEYLGGVVYAMAGGTWAHAAIAANVLGVLHGQLRGKPCRPFGSDLKVRIQFPAHTRFYYPDVTVLCAPSPPKSVYVDAPTIILEVASDSTRRTDEQEKREAYLAIPSLRAYVIFEQDQALATLWHRADQGFTRERRAGLEAVIDLPEISARLPLADVYEAIEFPADSRKA